MKRIILALAGVICVNVIFAQDFVKDEIKLYFDDTTSIDTINNELRKNNIPISVTEAYSETQRTINLIYKSDTNTIEIENIDDILEEIIKFTLNNNTYYICLLYANVGYNYFFLFDIQRGEVSTSGHFNYEQDDGYDFIYESLDDKGYINIIKHSTKQKDCIKLYFYQ